MPSISAVPEPVMGRVYVTVDFSDVPGVAYVALFRTSAANPSATGAIADWNIGNRGEYPVGLVRPHTAVDSTYGWYQGTSDGWSFWYDTEAPLDTPIGYTAIPLTFGTAISTDSDTTLGSWATFWLRNPLRPYSDLPLFNTQPQASDCIPRQGIYFQSMGDETYSSRSDLLEIDDSSLPIVSSRKRLKTNSTLTMITRTFADRDEVLAQASTGEIQMFQGAPQYGIEDRYLYTSDIPVQRPLSDHRRQWRVIQEPYQQTQRPVGLSYGAKNLTWADVCDGPYATWGAAETAGITTQGLVVGQASPPGGGAPTFRTWADVNAQFSSWTSVTSGGRTWEELLVGE